MRPVYPSTAELWSSGVLADSHPRLKRPPGLINQSDAALTEGREVAMLDCSARKFFAPLVRRPNAERYLTIRVIVDRREDER
jgi:hypothetical protein